MRAEIKKQSNGDYYIMCIDCKASTHKPRLEHFIRFINKKLFCVYCKKNYSRNKTLLFQAKLLDSYVFTEFSIEKINDLI